MSTPNTWATATVQNDWGKQITNVTLKHRYDTDWRDEHSWASIEPGASGEPFKVGYWTGFGRTGKDYWLLSFEVDGVVWTCKDTFYCYLTSGDADKLVRLRVFPDGNEGRLEVVCPKSSNCKVTLDSGVAVPNTWATATVKNDWGQAIYGVQLNHRYDDKHYDAQTWDQVENGKSGAPAMKVGFWTGFGRTGYDYWLVKFEAEGKVWTCKDNFYCFLTDKDRDGAVTCRVYKDGEEGKMEVVCPKSSNCTVSLSSADKKPVETTRPVYVIGHRCNDPGDIGLAISHGCNGVECDLHYDKNTQQIFVNHDFASGTTLSGWLNNAADIARKYPRQFAVIIFDCKFASAKDAGPSSLALSQALRAVRTAFAGMDPPVNVVFSIARYEDREVFNASAVEGLRANEGFSIDQSDDPAAVQAYFKQVGVANAWYGDGIFAAGTKDVYPYVKKGAELRDADGVLKKVYVWTLASESSIRKYIDEGTVDAVMVNVPGTVVGGINGLAEALRAMQKTTKARMAVRADPPFQVWKAAAPAR